MKFFNPFGTKEIIVRFQCPECGHQVTSESITVPTPDFSAERAADSYNDNDGYAICDTCEKEYQIDVWVSFADGYIDIDDVDEDEIEIEEFADPDELAYYEQQFEERASKFELYDAFKQSISNLKKLNEVDLGDEELNTILKRQIYTGVVATMETFLADAFINLTLTDDDCVRRFIKSHPEFRRRKFELRDIFEQHKQIRDTTKAVILDTIYHDLPKVREMYHSTFEIDFPAVREPLKCVMVRHDLVHRNGKTKDGTAVELNTDIVNTAITTIETFVGEIAGKLNLKLPPELPPIDLDEIIGGI